MIPQQNPGTLYLHQRLTMLAMRLAKMLFMRNLRDISTRVYSMPMVLR